jgi:GntR family transcriptional regulator
MRRDYAYTFLESRSGSDSLQAVTKWGQTLTLHNALPHVSQCLNTAVEIRISKESSVPLRQQIAAQIEYQIATGKMKPGEPLPSVRTLARQLSIHHNTVSQAYQDLTFLQLLSRKHGSRLIVRTPEERAIAPHPDLDDLINETIRVARRHGYSIQELSRRVRERLAEEPPDHVLVLSIDPGMRRLLQAEVEKTLKCRVKACSPGELVASPELALGALVVSPPGVLPTIAGVLPKERPAITVLYSSAEVHFDVVRKLTRPSVVAVVSVSEAFVKIACGLLGHMVGTRHTLIDCLLSDQKTAQIPSADLLFCDAITFSRLRAHSRAKNVIPYNLVSPECLDQIASALGLSNRSLAG